MSTRNLVWGLVLAMLGSVVIADVASAQPILDPCSQCHRVFPYWACVVMCGG